MFSIILYNDEGIYNHERTLKYQINIDNYENIITNIKEDLIKIKNEDLVKKYNDALKVIKSTKHHLDSDLKNNFADYVRFI